MKALIGVDIGTQGTKSALFTQEGDCLADAFCPSRLHRPAPGVVEEDPERQLESVHTTIRECLRKSRVDAGSVAGIGVDGQMAGVIGIGRDGRCVTPYDSWLDSRCAPQIEQMEKQAGDEILASSGCAPGLNHGPKILWWKQQRPKAYRQIASFVQPGGYVAMRLCGLDSKRAYIDKTYLHFSGFADNRRSQWNSDLCGRFDVASSKLPRIVDSLSVVGELSGDALRSCGLPASVPVVAGCGDTVASFLACGAVAEGIAVDVAGTASVFAATTSAFRADMRHRTLGCGQSAVPGLWHPYAYINGGGINLEWFRREFCKDGKTTLTLARLDELAAGIDPCDNLPIFVPHLGGRACPSRAHLRGGFANLSWEHTAAHLYRAVLEGVALEYALYQQVLREMFGGLKLKQLRITGGGQKSALWNSIKADALQSSVVRIAQSEGAPRGAAMVAGVGIGLLPNLATASKKWVTLGEKTRPRKSLAGFYTRRLAAYQKLVASLENMYS